MVMEALHHLLQRAASDGVLTPLAPAGLWHRTTIYVDDVVTFLKPERRSLRACVVLLTDFGTARDFARKWLSVPHTRFVVRGASAVDSRSVGIPGDRMALPVPRDAFGLAQDIGIAIAALGG